MKHLPEYLLLITSCLYGGNIQAKEKPSSPNLVFIMADQWRGQAIGYLGVEPVQTPNLDKLATEGVHFTDAISSYPVSSPARGMLMTGMYPISSKVTGNCNSDNTPYHVELPTSARCWSDVLKDQGYELGYIGKWHLDAPYQPYIDCNNNKGKIAWNEWCPKERRHGFSHWIAYGTYDYHLKPMYWNTDATRDEFYFVDQWGPEYEADRAIDYIANQDNKLRDSSKPFALVVSMNPPHTGYELVPDKYKEIYRNLDIESLCNSPIIAPKGTEYGDFYRKSVLDYYACMTGVDDQVGRIIHELKERGLFDNTIVVFTSDHGDSMGMHDHIGKNIYYEEAMRVPMILTWPEKIAPRRDSSLTIAFADLYPSLLSLMGFKERIPAEVQTFDLSASILSPKEAQEVVQPYYYVLPENLTSGYRGLRTKKYTFVVHATNAQADEWILFDREQDPFQLNNIAPDQPELIKQFSSRLKDWLKKTNDPFVNCFLPRPAPHQLKWHEAEMGVVFHYDLHVFDGIRYGQGNNRVQPVEDYSIFNPTQLDTDQWIRAAKAAGAKFAVLTATHETGFAIYQSDVNPYCLKAVKWRDGKGDIIRDFVNSCRKYNIMPGIYVGIRWNSLFGVHNFKVQGEGEFAANRQQWYKHFCERMVEELCSRYGDLFMIWFDGGADDPKGDGPDVLPIVSKYQPECLFYHNIDRADFRWGGSESGTVGYPCWSSFPYPYSHSNNTEGKRNHTDLLKHGDKDGKYWVPAMADAPLRGMNGRHEWFWEPDDEANIYPVDSLMNMYYKSVGRNATLILGVTPDTTGLIPAGDAQRLKEWGDEINRRFSSPLASISGQKKSLTLKLDKAQSVNHCIIQENIQNGERIRQYKVEAKVKGKWQTVCEGESVGHKRIEEFPTVDASALRLIVTGSVAQPDIRNFSVYNVQL